MVGYGDIIGALLCLSGENLVAVGLSKEASYTDALFLGMFLINAQILKMDVDDRGDRGDVVFSKPSLC